MQEKPVTKVLSLQSDQILYCKYTELLLSVAILFIISPRPMHWEDYVLTGISILLLNAPVNHSES